MLHLVFISAFHLDKAYSDTIYFFYPPRPQA